jgi:hypothetical protein
VVGAGDGRCAAGLDAIRGDANVHRDGYVDRDWHVDADRHAGGNGDSDPDAVGQRKCDANGYCQCDDDADCVRFGYRSPNVDADRDGKPDKDRHRDRHRVWAEHRVNDERRADADSWTGSGADADRGARRGHVESRCRMAHRVTDGDTNADTRGASSSFTLPAGCTRHLQRAGYNAASRSRRRPVLNHAGHCTLPRS